jgi:hypothetical protein
MVHAATVSFVGKYTTRNGEQLGQRLLAELGQPPNACWLFGARREGLESFVQGISNAVKTSKLVGCTTDGEVSGNGFNMDSAILAGVVSKKLSFDVASVANLSADSESAGRTLAQKLPSTVKYILLFSDGITGNGCALLRGMQSILDPGIPICGGTAADGNRFQQTFQFVNNQVLTDAAVAIGFSGEFQIGFGIGSGWSPVGIGRTVTKANGTILYELDNEPALEVYKRCLGKHAEKLPGVGVEYPLALIEEKYSCMIHDYYPFLLRATMAVYPQDGSIKFAGEIPQGTVVRLTCGDHQAILEATRRAVNQAKFDLGQAKPALAFLFSCMARKIILGRHIRDEIQIIKDELGPGVPIVGFYSYGEYSPIKLGAPSLLHNETASISILGN